MVQAFPPHPGHYMLEPNEHIRQQLDAECVIEPNSEEHVVTEDQFSSICGVVAE
jgi:hypothetical protein